METYKILNVKIVDGKTLRSNWKSPMQVIETDKGTFIDNLSPLQFGFYNTANPGFDWESYIGKEVSNVKVFHSRGFAWLNKQ